MSVCVSLNSEACSFENHHIAAFEGYPTVQTDHNREALWLSWSKRLSRKQEVLGTNSSGASRTVVSVCRLVVGQETLTVQWLFLNGCRLDRDLRISLFCAQSLQTSPSRMGTKPEVKPSSGTLWHTGGLCGALHSALDFCYAR